MTIAIGSIICELSKLWKSVKSDKINTPFQKSFFGTTHKCKFELFNLRSLDFK